jgi:predicted phosphodiesterase
MIAILSDIHGNLEALQAVLADIDREKVDAIYCLGDTVGYGPNPVECLDLVTQMAVVLMGNHDQAALFDPQGFGPGAERAILWSRAQMDGPCWSAEQREKRWLYLADRPRTHQEGKYLYVHGSARDPLHEYVFPDDIFNAKKMGRIFAQVEQYCFQGHTHIPGVFAEDLRYAGLPDMRFDKQLGAHICKLGLRKTLINVGSVGQPRDGDPRACYALQDGGTLRFRRVEYDIETTVNKIFAIPELDRFLGERLREGR